MKKVDLTKIEFSNVEGKKELVNIAPSIGNALYMGRSIVESELGSKVYHSADPMKIDKNADCTIELSDEEAKMVYDCVKNVFGYVICNAVKDALGL